MKESMKNKTTWCDIEIVILRVKNRRNMKTVPRSYDICMSLSSTPLGIGDEAQTEGWKALWARTERRLLTCHQVDQQSPHRLLS